MRSVTRRLRSQYVLALGCPETHLSKESMRLVTQVPQFPSQVPDLIDAELQKMPLRGGFSLGFGQLECAQDVELLFGDAADAVKRVGVESNLMPLDLAQGGKGALR